MKDTILARAFQRKCLSADRKIGKMTLMISIHVEETIVQNSSKMTVITTFDNGHNKVCENISSHMTHFVLQV